MRRHRVTIASVLMVLSVLAAFPPACAASGDYVVVAGDTLFEIAAEVLGDGNRYLEIVEATNAANAADPTYAFIENPDRIEIGWVLALPAAAVAPQGARILVQGAALGRQKKGV